MCECRLVPLLYELSEVLKAPAANANWGEGIHQEVSYALCAYRQRVPAEQGADQATKAAR